ncbi:MAG: hypothetical protein M3R30_10640 [Candidatus Eremiobacteraeota bacterium]|nr:hypothetical protein [Candidatus Eremiobacteraeota bacterium]
MKFARTIRFDAAPDAAERAALERSIAAAAGRVAWRGDAATGRTYGLVETPEPAEFAVSGTSFAGAIIALAVTPRPPEAFPALVEALGGAGRPAGIASCELVGDELVLEWDPAVSAASLVIAVLDAELRRFAGTRVSRSLAPLPDAVTAMVAAGGLGAPEIGSDRILETYLEATHGRV